MSNSWAIAAEGESVATTADAAGDGGREATSVGVATAASVGEAAGVGSEVVEGPPAQLDANTKTATDIAAIWRPVMAISLATGRGLTPSAGQTPVLRWLTEARQPAATQGAFQ